MPIYPPTPDTMAVAARILREGGLVGMPTETVYGLAADATNGDAVARVFERKERPRFNPLIVHFSSADAAWSYADPVGAARLLAMAFWPGPLTLVLPMRREAPLSGLVTAGLDTVAVRVPDHEVALALITAAGVPLAAPSANRSGRISPTTAAAVTTELGEDIFVLDGGTCERGLESTVVALDALGGARLLRPGGVATADIEAVIGRGLDCIPPIAEIGDNEDGEAATPASPGQLASHYAPRAMVRLDALDVRAGEALLSFGPMTPPADGPQFNLSPSGDLVEAARNFFAALRLLDDSGVETIAAMPVPEHGLGEAINDRLRRAAHGRR